MANCDSTQRTLINGCKPVTITDIECMAYITMEQATAMAALFRVMARLADDEVIKELCNHGALQADLQGNDIDVLRERAVKAGFNPSGICAETAEVPA